MNIMYAKDLYETKYQHLINKREKVGIDHLNDPKAFIDFSIVFITQSYFKVPKDVSLNSTHFFIMKIPNKRALQ